MMKKAIVLLFLMTLMLPAKDYTKNPNTKQFIDRAIQKYGFEKAYLQGLFSDVKVQHDALRIFRPRSHVKRTPEEIAALKKRYPKYGAWDRYVKTILTDERAAQGAAYIKRYSTTFEKVEKKYGVPKEYIAAIIGVESAYGKNVGKYPVFDT